MTESIRIYENLRSIAYAPFYLAQVSGEFAAQGLRPEIITSPDPAETAAGLLAGRVDVSWGGPMRVMLHHDADAECPLVCFCQVVARDPFYLVGRVPNPTFRFTDLVGRRLGVTNEVPTPWMTLQDDLQRAGIDARTLQRLPDASMADLAGALRRAEADVVQLAQPHVNRLVEEGAGHIWHAFAQRGDIGFTTFYTTRDLIDRRPGVCAALSRALHSTLGAVHVLDPHIIATRIASYFPDLDKSFLAGCISGYADSGLWARDTMLSPSAFVRLKAALLSGGLIARDVPFEYVVDNRFALGDMDPTVARSNPGPAR